MLVVGCVLYDVWNQCLSKLLCWCFWFVCLCCCTPQFKHSFVLALGYVSMSLGIACQARIRVIVGSWVCLFKQGLVLVVGELFIVVGNRRLRTVLC